MDVRSTVAQNMNTITMVGIIAAATVTAVWALQLYSTRKS